MKVSVALWGQEQLVWINTKHNTELWLWYVLGKCLKVQMNELIKINQNSKDKSNSILPTIWDKSLAIET